MATRVRFITGIQHDRAAIGAVGGGPALPDSYPPARMPAIEAVKLEREFKGRHQGR